MPYRLLPDFSTIEYCDEWPGMTMIEVTFIRGVKISTVFFGEDIHGSFFETMVFGGKLDGEQNRYNNIHDAKNGHVLVCRDVRASEGLPEPTLPPQRKGKRIIRFK